MVTGNITLKELCKEAKHLVVSNLSSHLDAHLVRIHLNHAPKPRIIRFRDEWVMQYPISKLDIFSQIKTVKVAKTTPELIDGWLYTMRTGDPRIYVLRFTLIKESRLLLVY